MWFELAKLAKILRNEINAVFIYKWVFDHSSICIFIMFIISMKFFYKNFTIIIFECHIYSFIARYKIGIKNNTKIVPGIRNEEKLSFIKLKCSRNNFLVN